MKNIVFFITHKTLTIEHAELTLGSFSRQKCASKFDVLYLYNTHEDELSNESLIELIEKFNVKKFFNDIRIFSYNRNTPKTLGSDIALIKQFCKDNFESEDRVLLVKSDSVLSVNYFDDVLNRLPKYRDVYFVAPFICAKKRVSNENIIEYSNREVYIKSDEITFFVEDQYQSNDNDFFNRPDVKLEDEKILYTSCYVIRDFSCHFLSISLFDLVRIREQSWGGVWFSELTSHFIPTDRSFVIHKYHSIKSENRENDREGPVEGWITS